ncbi:MAG: hypothetical protein K6G31_05580 [Paludibacteraceae bacterium]|nr:hypothetical protein [Paludibacteraceae bacterium]MBR6042670.1 hypothetical protein [Paludibacteraceae bacterium]MCR5568729.1 hypothetical protein [Paludibacteraceae bacterium]
MNTILNRLKLFIIKHYLVVSYLVIAAIFVLSILFSENLQFLIHMLACLVVIVLFAAIGVMAYMTIRALFADHQIDKKSIKVFCILSVILLVLYPIFKYGLKVDELEKLYLLAPIASWPCFIAIFILNLNTKWGKHREKKRLNKQ